MMKEPKVYTINEYQRPMYAIEKTFWKYADEHSIKVREIFDISHWCILYISTDGEMGYVDIETLQEIEINVG